MASSKSQALPFSAILGRILVLLFVVSGLGLCWLIFRMIRGILIQRALQKYYLQVQAVNTNSRLSVAQFPLAFYRQRLPGMNQQQVAAAVFGPFSVERLQPKMLFGSYLDLYHFKFGPSKNHRLIVIYNEQHQVIRVQGENFALFAG